MFPTLWPQTCREPRGDLHMETAPLLPLNETAFNGTTPGTQIFIPGADRKFPAWLYFSCSFHPALAQSVTRGPALLHMGAIPRFCLHGLAVPAVLDQKKEPDTLCEPVTSPHFSPWNTDHNLEGTALNIWMFYHAMKYHSRPSSI